MIPQEKSGFNRSNFKQSGKTTRLLNALLGGAMLGLPIVPIVASAQTNPLNPCPQIYYEEPFNSTRAVPQGCPPNAATMEQTGGIEQNSVTPSESTTPGATSQPPLPGSLQSPSAVVAPVNGVVDVQLVNQTNTAVSYEVIGSTDQRMLNGRSTATLQGLAVPINITFVRPDGGFVQVTPRETAPGVLEVTLVEAADVDNGQGALNIQENGNVYLN